MIAPFPSTKALVLLLVLAACHSNPTVTTQPKQQVPAVPAEFKPLAASNNALGLDLFARLRAQKGNLMLSPISVATALTMTWAGARGDTAREMRNALHLHGSAEEEFERAGKLIRAYQEPGLGLTPHFASRLFGDARYDFRSDYLDHVSVAYGARLERADFAHASEAGRARINDWIAAVTEDHVKDLIPRGAIDETTRLVLSDAVYFRGAWDRAFKVEDTRLAPFHVTAEETKYVPTMPKLVWCAFDAADGVKILELPYAGGALAMMLVLPDQVDGLDAVETRLSPAMLAHWAEVSTVRRVAVRLPRFEITPTAPLDLGPPLQAMGMVRAFDPTKADLGGLAEPHPERLHLSRMFHTAFIRIDETGTEPATAFARMMAHVSGGKTEWFVADHPFLFFIRDVRSGMILFMGRVADPIAW